MPEDALFIVLYPSISEKHGACGKDSISSVVITVTCILLPWAISAFVDFFSSSQNKILLRNILFVPGHHYFFFFLLNISLKP